MVLLLLARDFFSRFVGSGNYKMQIGVQVGRKSVVVLSGRSEASYSHFFIGLGFDRSREQNSPDKKTGVGSLHDPRGYDGRLPPDAGYYLDLVIPRFEEPPKKNTCVLQQHHGRY